MSVEISIPLPRLSPYVVEVVREPCIPNWEHWYYPELFPRKVFAGINRYAQIVYELEVKPSILETDPGPLDARVS